MVWCLFNQTDPSLVSHALHRTVDFAGEISADEVAAIKQLRDRLGDLNSQMAQIEDGKKRRLEVKEHRREAKQRRQYKANRRAWSVDVKTAQL